MGIVALSVTACGIPRNLALTTMCVLPEDQSKAFIGKWAVTPIPVAVSRLDFYDSGNDPEGRQVVSNALTTWNHFSIVSFGYEIFDFKNSDGSVKAANQANISSSVCSYYLLQGDSFQSPVVIHKNANFSSSLSSVIALTHHCKTSGTYSFQSASIEINVRDFFAEGKPSPDAESVLAHEAGHLIGLDHSCEFSGTKVTAGTMPNCNSRTLSTHYKNALMFPSFDLDGTRRNRLNSNDMGRANCLYGQ